VERSGHEISGEKERSVGQNVVDEDENEEVEEDEEEEVEEDSTRGGWADCGTWRNFAQADWTRRTAERVTRPS